MLKFEEETNGPSGHLHLEVFKGGKLIEVFDEKNLVVDGSKQQHARMLGGDVASRSVTTFGVGTNGTAPAVGNTALTSAFTKSIDTVSYPDTNKVQFDFSLSSAEANGKAILEFGLMTAGGILYARRIRSSALNKEADISISGSWVITF